MLLVGILTVIGIFQLVWDYRFSWAHNFLLKLREKEPGFFAQYCEKGIWPPTSKVGRLIGEGSYLRIESVELRNELIRYSGKQTKWQTIWAMRLPIIIGLLLLSIAFSRN